MKSGSKPTTTSKAASLLLVLVYLLQVTLGPVLACHKVYFGDPKLQNIACKCNASHCDHELDFHWPRRDDAAFVRLLSTKSGARFQRSLLHPSPGPGPENTTGVGVDYVLEVEVNRRRQQVLGYGGAFTDSASRLLMELGEGELRGHALEDYFGPRGLGYNLGRVPIGGTDMSWRAYSYDDLADGPGRAPEDLDLEHFRLQPEDLDYKIPLIKLANELLAKSRERDAATGTTGSDTDLKLMAASWSAPSWMKSNGNLVQGKLRGNSSSRPSYYDAYARYQVRFLQEYARQNLSIWALSPQNEPHSPKRVGPIKINFNSVNFEPQELADYLANSLVPELIRAGKTPDKLKLFIWDDTLDGLQEYQEAALASPQVANYTLGLAIHWYTTGLNEKPYRLLYETRQRLPSRYSLLSTEACFIGRPRPGEWWRGERYARDLIENLRAGSVGWLDWNLALNMSGGPTWSNNLLDSAMLVDTSANYYKNPMYYALGHLTRFIAPNSHILQSQVVALRNPQPQEELTMVAAELEEPLLLEEEAGGARSLKRRLAVVVLNRNQASARRVRLQLNECYLKRHHPALELELPASSLTSLAFVC